MTGPDALAKIVSALGDHSYRNSGNSPAKRVTIGNQLAWDLCKLTRNELGELAQAVMKKGPKAFEENGLFGIAVEIDPQNDGYDVKVHE